MSEISKEQVLHVAHLARLEMSEKEAENFSSQLADIIAMADTLNELNTDNIEPTSHVFAQKNVMREDKKVEGLPLEDVLKNVPEEEDGQIKVPSIID
ncbi:Asp-tRNA(Asn)/Glu-tRNA(Gln) amidotransferase subunit GatC [Lederbergia galactosidilytica]|uniref:Aspartyl/glutamyl-tRNA(Asn/Gln) amidotransferase subunit C n=1 Tax=Lederbergia galactosidilytica TaxID=217031 RepID=A0A177ZSP1_9BACI|nr:Asp-tRNA(Asn)/Glu-tRNA(Gln) amidotransferase subunit GatC [Lederbergia galactosidilytica]KRG14378.1 glutamyl-tRNA amidotransferase [Virgibacillus soli]MBP1916695.1 aspartyl-tRNA(Asn)/glutamyl-tRNA(Gln) amidotransferase subunit C [Lederbergia galactosidilytica]OAK70956.1 glutamyl-tRNA amidotransferase [Lederbergia galactosidilytica]